MIICSCNVLTDGQITACTAQQDGVVRLRDVYQQLGCRPQCGRCVRTIAGLLRANGITEAAGPSQKGDIDQVCDRPAD
ncbi:MAG: (2Fe-2S)-binding protein [Hyphomicrobiales bacterium]|nr:(2Fe-2S)-binding protein [Hyphomicrobiales bacterium]